MSKACVDCQFFVKETRGTGGPATLAILESERTLARANDYSWHKDNYALACDYGVWDQGHSFDPNKKHEAIVNLNRSGYCFFYKYKPGMLLPAARILQEREAGDREARRDRQLTLWGLWIAALALVANVVLQIFALDT